MGRPSPDSGRLRRPAGRPRPAAPIARDLLQPDSRAMDITLIKTFLEVSNTGSFVAASERLFVTQSAVSLRIQRLEDNLGKPLFARSKAGAELTPAGREFEHYALALIRVWQEARQQIAIPEGFTQSVSIGAEYSLWPRLGFRWIDGMRALMPDLGIRTEIGRSERLTQYLSESVVQAALMYMPTLRPGLQAVRILEEELVMVATWQGADFEAADFARHYVFVDWGEEFGHAHERALPNLTNPGLTMALGAMTAEFVVNRTSAAYLPARYIKTYLDRKLMHLVADAPRFPYPVWAVWRDDLDPALRKSAELVLRNVAKDAENAGFEVLDALAAISVDHEVEILGVDGAIDE